MFTHDFYWPMAKSLARTFSGSTETREDLMQEGLLKIYSTIEKYPKADYSSSDWKAQAYVIMKHAMIDHVRKLSRRSKVQVSEEAIPLGNIPTQEASQFENLCSEYALQELHRFLPILENLILQEILKPSEEYRLFARKKRAVFNIYNKFYGLEDPPKYELQQEATLADYFQITTPRVREAMQRIKSIAQQKIDKS